MYRWLHLSRVLLFTADGGEPRFDDRWGKSILTGTAVQALSLTGIEQNVPGTNVLNWWKNKIQNFSWIEIQNKIALNVSQGKAAQSVLLC